MGHSMDGDSEQYAVRYMLLPEGGDDLEFHGALHASSIATGSIPDPRNSVAPGPENWWSYDVSYRRPVHKGWIEIGVGMDQEDRKWDDDTALLPRGTITWHRGF